MSDLPGLDAHDTLDGAYAGTNPDDARKAAAYVVARLGDAAADVLAALGLEVAA